MESTQSRTRVAPRRLVWVGPLTIITAAIANMIVRILAVAFFGVPETFQYLQASFIIGSTIIYLLLALLAFVLVSRFARQPMRFYRVLGLVALCVSFLSPLMLPVGVFPVAGMNLHIFWTMIVMHLVSAAIVVGLLTRLPREQH
jgi:Family of unknown function (DUF6069)